MSVKRNFIYNVAYQVLALALPLVTAPYLSRILGSTGVGTYSYTFSIANYFVLFAMLGVNNYGNRSVAMARSDPERLRRTFWSIWTLQAVIGSFFAIIYVAYSVLLASEVTYALIWLPYVVTGALDVNWLFFGLERFKVTVARNFIVKLLTFALVFLVVRGSNALINYLLLMSASNLLSVLVLWPFVIREIPLMRPSVRDVIAHLKPNLVLFVPVIAVSLYTVLDKVMLGSMCGMSESGIFENSLRVAEMPFTLITALGTVMLPHATGLHSEGRGEEAVAGMSPSIWFAMLLSSAFAFGILAVTPEFVPVFFGTGFDACTIVMPIIAMEMPFKAWANVIRTQWLIPTSRDRAYVSSVIVGALVNLVVNLILIPRMGAVGAGIGLLVAQAAVCAVQTWAVRGDLPLGKWAKESAPALLIGLLMFATVRMLAPMFGGGIGGLLAEILTGVVAFSGISLIWLKVIRSLYLVLIAESIQRLVTKAPKL